ncbi:MAG TPA: helix-turn-helix domain-containing protein [Streptosporangiaceae bacterium]|jgi:excisionase family DNA binding protein
MTQRPAAQALEERLADPKFWTVAETSVLLRVSKMTVYRLIHDKALESVRIGRAFRIPEKAIADYFGGPEDGA